MTPPEYRFVTTWRVRSTCAEVSRVLADPLDLPRWWPSVYLSVTPAEPPRKRFHLLTRGWLPYRLRWDLEVLQTNEPHGFTIGASGDFEGTGVWVFRQDGDEVEMVYDWRVLANKPLLRRLSFALRPVFAANHRWAMRQGEISLRGELERRRSATEGRP